MKIGWQMVLPAGMIVKREWGRFDGVAEIIRE
jgi:hypothetical protein